MTVSKRNLRTYASTQRELNLMRAEHNKNNPQIIDEAVAFYAENPPVRNHSLYRKNDQYDKPKHTKPAISDETFSLMSKLSKSPLHHGNNNGDILVNAIYAYSNYLTQPQKLLFT